MTRSAPSVALVDNGGSNLNSVSWALRRLGVDPVTTADADTIARATRVVLPGVGAARAGMSRLHAAELIDCVRRLQQPVLGVCLGMQLLFEHSEEGDTAGLGLIPGVVRAMRPGDGVRVPHMGWNRIRVKRPDPLLSGLDSAWFYFVHGFAADPASVGRHALAACDHGHEFVAVARRKNFWGVQFHPEKSAAAGARLFNNFLEV